jgi:ribonuclease P protein subunit RPR2
MSLSKRKRKIFKKNKLNYKKIAEKRIEQLLKEAEANKKNHPERSDRYAELAYKLKLKYKIKLCPELKRRICKKCHHYMIPGKTCSIRIHNSKIIYTCKNCGDIRRFKITK